jgi:3'-5' exoribonuclease
MNQAHVNGFQNYISRIDCKALRNTCDCILSLYPKFRTWPASLSFHHAYEGGLLAHTVEVTDFAMCIASIGGVDKDILLTACLWHDVAKTLDYDYMTFPVNSLPAGRTLLHKSEAPFKQTLWYASQYYNRIRHVSGSAIEFAHHARLSGVPQGVEEAVVHAILSHHGRKEWGSPVEPQSKEALILHQADMLSANYERPQ